MLQHLLYLIGFVIYTVSSDAVCRSEPKNLIMCIRPLLDTWEHIRNEESHASNLLIPVPFYSRPAIFALCNNFISTKKKCFEGDCPDNMMLSFVKGQLGFVCGPNLPLYIENYDCLTSSLLKSRQCLQSVYGMPNPLNSTGQCTGLTKFFNCTAGSLQKSCGGTSAALLNGVIEQLGCENFEGLQYRSDMKKTNESGQFTEESLKEYLKRESPKYMKDWMASKENATESAPPASETTKLAVKNTTNPEQETETTTRIKQSGKEVKLDFEEKTVEKKEVLEKQKEPELTTPEIVEKPSATVAPVILSIPTTIAFTSEVTFSTTKPSTTIKADVLIKEEPVTEKTITETPKAIKLDAEGESANVSNKSSANETTIDPGTTKIVFEQKIHIDPGASEIFLVETTTPEHLAPVTAESNITTMMNTNVTENREIARNTTEGVETSKKDEEIILPKTQNVREPEEVAVTLPQSTVQIAESNTTTKTAIIDFEKPMEDPQIEPLDEVLKHFKLSSQTKKSETEKEVEKKEVGPNVDKVSEITLPIVSNQPTEANTTKTEITAPVSNTTEEVTKAKEDEFKSGYENRTKPNFSKPSTSKMENNPIAKKEEEKLDNPSKDVKQREITEVVDEPALEAKLVATVPVTTTTEKVTTLATTSEPMTTTSEPDTTTLATTSTTRKITTTESTTTHKTTSTEMTKPVEKPTTVKFVRLSHRISASEVPPDPKDPKEPKCTDEDVEYVSACHEKLMRRISTFSSLPSNKVRFPLFNLTSTEVVAVCKVYDQGVRCSEAQNERCRDSHILTFINTQLESLCFRIYSMKYDYDCMRKTYLENMECIEKITGSAESTDKCTGQQESYDCFVHNSGSLNKASCCGEGALILIKEILRGYGCRVDTKPWLTKAPTTTTRRTRKPRTTTPMPTPTKEESEEIASDGLKKVGRKIETTTLAHEFTSGTTIDDLVEANKDLLETDAPSGPSIELVEKKSVRNRSVKDEMKPIVVAEIKEKEEVIEPQMTFHNQCAGEEKNKARVCVAPLLKSLILLRQWRPELTEMRFPIYKYTRGELLDLCDGYANAFLCAGHGPIRHCLKDELISFAQDHLGYQCSPQNIGRFMQHYDCIVNVEMPGPCAQFVKGEAVPGTTKGEKCNGIAAYRMCMLPLIRKSCAAGATSEFEQTIMQFGC